jgi:hypothetical protein
VVEETPAAGGFVDGEWGVFAVEDAFGVDGDVFGEEEGVVLPLGFFVDPETPVVVGDEGAVFGVGDFGFCGGLGRRGLTLWPGSRRWRIGGRCGGLTFGGAWLVEF